MNVLISFAASAASFACLQAQLGAYPTSCSFLGRAGSPVQADSAVMAPAGMPLTHQRRSLSMHSLLATLAQPMPEHHAGPRLAGSSHLTFMPGDLEPLSGMDGGASVAQNCTMAEIAMLQKQDFYSLDAPP